MPTPEELARENIDALLKQCGWMIQKRSEINLSAGSGIAITEGLLNLWREVLEYFDAYLIGLTATHSKQTIGFFGRNVEVERGGKDILSDLWELTRVLMAAA